MLDKTGAAASIKKDLQPFLPPGYVNPLRVVQHHRDGRSSIPMSLIQKLAASILRVTSQTVGLLYAATAEQFEYLFLMLDRLPTREELEAAVAALKPGGHLILTVAVKLADEARALLRSITALSMASASSRPGIKAPWTRTANHSDDPRRQGLGSGQSPQTVDLWAKKGDLDLIFLPPKPLMKVGRVRMPLRYPGGKSKAVGCVLPYVPSVPLVVSPFAGGLWVEGHLAARGTRIAAFDNDPHVINFWRCTKQKAARLADRVLALLADFEGFDNDHREEAYYRLRARYPAIKDRYERAAAWFSLNRCSFSCATLRSGYGRVAGARFNRASVERLRNVDLRRFEFGEQDFRDTIDSHPDDFLYLDPPYFGSFGVYGTPTTPHWSAQDHLDLFDRLKDRGHWVLHYDRCEEALTLYEGFPMVMVEWAYSLVGGYATTDNEILILPRGWQV